MSFFQIKITFFLQYFSILNSESTLVQAPCPGYHVVYNQGAGDFIDSQSELAAKYSQWSMAPQTTNWLVANQD